MPLYYFDVDDGDTMRDDSGTELPDLEAAHVEAVRLAGAVIEDHAQAFWGGKSWRFSVRDAAGEPKFTFSFSATPAQNVA